MSVWADGVQRGAESGGIRGINRAVVSRQLELANGNGLRQQVGDVDRTTRRRCPGFVLCRRAIRRRDA